MNSFILSTKVLLLSAGILSLAIAIKLSFPIALNEIPVIWSVVTSWLKPPYLYLIINVIIITIAATSRFHQTHSSPIQSEHSIATRPDYFSAQQPEVRTIVEASFPVQNLYDDDVVVEVKPAVLVNGLEVNYIMTDEEIVIPEIVMFETDIVNEEQMVPEIESEEMVSSEIRQLEPLISVKEKPLIASRLGKAKPVRTNPQVPLQKTLPRPTKHDTLENTWKMITEGRHETGPINVDHVPKSETFDDESSLSIRKEASPGQEELNRRVEEFIKKINEDMRIQRQESLNQYVEMISRGV